MKMNYTDEATFITEEIEISDDHIDLAKRIKQETLNFCNIISPIMIHNDRESLMFGISLFSTKYRVVIEKI